MDGVTAILQARMGSTRLPGKVVRPVLGRPLIAWELERLRRCRRVRDVVLATSDQTADDPVARVGADMGVTVFRGSEADVLDRYYRAAEQAGARHIMRITGDCPLLDPAVCDRAVEAFFAGEADYLVTSPAFAEGLDCEVFTFAALEAAWQEAVRPSEREHVTLFLRNRPERFRCLELANDRDDSRYRVTVDEDADLAVVKAVLEALVPAHGTDFGFDRVRAFLDAHPDIANLNERIVRNEGLLKSLREEEGQCG